MTGNQAGDWRELCKQVSRECDPEKVLDLMHQLNRALSQQRAKLMDSQPNPGLGQFGAASPGNS
jgi:hypothetical protein